jgi:hypothetical protein
MTKDSSGGWPLCRYVRQDSAVGRPGRDGQVGLDPALGLAAVRCGARWPPRGALPLPREREDRVVMFVLGKTLPLWASG